MSVPPFFRPDVIYRMVPMHEAPDSILLGWVPTNALEGTIHAPWSVLMMWVSVCPMRVPLRAQP